MGRTLDETTEGDEGVIAERLMTLCGLTLESYSESLCTLKNFARGQNDIVKRRGRWFLTYMGMDDERGYCVDTNPAELVGVMVGLGMLKQALSVGDATLLDRAMVEEAV